MGTVCPAQRRPDADIDSARCRDDTAAMPHHRGWPSRRQRQSNTVLSERVLSQWLYQEPETTGSFLQHARRVFVQGHFRTLSGGKDGEGGLLADVRGPE